MLAALIVPGGGVLPGRPAIALVVVMFVPGWAVLRLVGAPLHAISVLGSLCGSISLAMLTSLAAVGWFGWHWRALALLWMLASAGALVAVIARPPLPRELHDDLDDDLVEPAWDDRTWAIAQPQWHTGSTASTAPVDDDVDVFDERLLWLLTLTGVIVAGVAIVFADPGDIDGYGLIAAVSLWFSSGVAAARGALRASPCRRPNRAHRRRVNLASDRAAARPAGIHRAPATIPGRLAACRLRRSHRLRGRVFPRLDARLSWRLLLRGSVPGAVWLTLRTWSGCCDSPRWWSTLPRRWPCSRSPALVGTAMSRSIVAATIFVFDQLDRTGLLRSPGSGFRLGDDDRRNGPDVLLRAAVGRPTAHPVARIVGRLPSAITGRSATFVYLACVFVAAGIIVSHQLSPPMLVAMLLALAFVGRTRTEAARPHRRTRVRLGMSHAAESYWVGHLDDVFGEVGDVGGLLNSNVSRRTRPARWSRGLVVRSRIALDARHMGAGGRGHARTASPGPPSIRRWRRCSSRRSRCSPCSPTEARRCSAGAVHAASGVDTDGTHGAAAAALRIVSVCRDSRFPRWRWHAWYRCSFSHASAMSRTSR